MSKTLAWLDRISSALNAVMKCLGLAFIAIVIASSTLQVFTRYILNSSLFWTEECARFAFIWATMCGSVIGVRNRSHAAIDLLSNRLGGRWKTLNARLVDVLLLAMGILLFITGMTLTTASAKQLSPAIRIPMSYVYGAVPVCALVIAVNAVVNLLGRKVKE